MSIKDPKSYIAGYLVGQALRRNRGKTVVREPVAYLYNGVRLPELPESELPYAIMESTDSGTVRVYFTDKPCVVRWWETGGINVAYALSGCAVDIYKTASEYSWQFFAARTLTSDLKVGDLVNILWTSYNLADENGTVYLAASDPIPVYE